MKNKHAKGPLSIIVILVLFFAQNAVAQTYCASKGNLPWQEWIANVQFGTINNASQKEGYGNFTSQTVSLAQGSSTILTVTQGFSWAADPSNGTQQGRAWIDYNKNGTFEDTEIVASFTRSSATANVVIPATATNGTTRMRISLKTSGVPTACETFDKGEVEDYTVNITGGGVATQPDLAITDVVADPTLRLDAPYRVSFHLRNLGAGTPANFFISLFNISIKNNAPNSASFQLKNVFTIDSIPSGFDSTITFSAFMPNFVTFGSNTITITTESGNRIAESNETNNVFTATYAVPVSTTDNSKLKVTNVTGATTGVPNGNLPVNVTIQNTSNLASSPDSLVFVGYSAVAFNVSRFNYYNYGKNRIAIPSIPAGGTITIPANFILPKELTSFNALLPSKKQTIEPYILTQSELERFGTDFQFPVGSYFYPVKPSAQADIAVTGRVLTTYSRQNQTLNFELTIRNLGINKAKNVRVAIDSCFSRAGLNQFKDCLSNLTVVAPSVGRAEDLITLNGSLEEDRGNHPIYYLDSIDVNQTITVALRGTLSPREFFGPGLKVVPDSFEIQPKILNVDAVDNNAANNQTTLLKFLKSPNNELTISNCPSNIVVTAAVGSTTAIATFGQPTGVSTAVCAPNTGISVLQRTFPSSGQAFPIGVNQVRFDVVDGCNNLKTCAFNVTVNAQTNGLPDLIFNGYSGAFNYSGTPINWNFFSIKNNGSATATAPFTLDAYLSTDSIFSANDVLLGKTTFNQSLLQGQAVDVPKGNFITPKNTPEGAYYVIYKLDGGNVVNEFSETNNTFFATQNVSNPDVNIFSVFTTPTLLFATVGNITRGDQVTLSDSRTFWNSGQRTDKFTTKFYFSRDTVLSADDYVIRTLTDSIFPFARVDLLFNSSLVPNTFTSGTYYLIYELDTENVIFESNETNNKGILPINWNNGSTTALPDLTITGITVPITFVEQGQNLNFSFDAKNIGTAAATGSFTIKSYLSIDQVLDASDYQNGSIPTANYAIGQNILQIGGAMSVSNAVAAGSYYLFLKIDADNQITESNENNNVVYFGTSIIVTAVTSTNYCASKGIAPWEYAISNVQFGTINNTSDKFKDFATLGYSDYTNLTTTVAKGQSYPLSITPLLSWIGNLPNAFARVWIDFNQNKTFEANELVLEKTNANPLTQNVLIPTTALTGATRMRVSLKNGAYPTACETFDKGEVEDYTVNITGETGGTPQLAITNVTGPASAVVGSQITLTVTVKNTGTAPTVPTKLYYAQTPTVAEPLILTDNTLTIAPLAVNETRVINFTLTLKSPIYPPNAQYISGYSNPYEFGDYVVVATNVERSVGVPSFSATDPKFVFNVAPTFPQANISVNVVPNKTSLNRNEPWNAVYTIKNNSTTLIKQVFFNLGTFQRTSRNFLAKNYDVLSVGALPVNSTLKRTIGEIDIVGLEMFDLAAGESRNVMLNFSRILTYADQGGSTDTTITGTLPFPFVNLASNVVNTNATVGAPISINVGTPIGGNQPDLTLTNLTIPTSTVQQGNILSFNADFRNIGTAAAGNFTVKSYLSTDNVLSANDYADGSVPTANYAAGQTVLQVPAAMTVRNTLAAGEYYLILKIDGDNVITESNENNNVVVSTGLITVTAPTTGGSDIALTMTADPSVYRAFSTSNFRISAKNNGTTAFTNVKIKFTKPANTVAGGTKVASIGTFNDYCPGGLECSEWTIPTLAGGATATLDAPIYVLSPTGAITATANLLSSTPTDNVVANNTASVTLNQATAPAVQPLVQSKPTQLIPVVIQKISPTITENYIVVELESIVEKTIDFQMIDALGTVVQTEKMRIEKGNNKQHFDVSNLPKGLYFIQTNVGKGRDVPTKFIKL